MDLNTLIFILPVGITWGHCTWGVPGWPGAAPIPWEGVGHWDRVAIGMEQPSALLGAES